MLERVGIFYQAFFPFGAFGPRDWSLSEHKRAFRWLRDLGYTDVAFAALPIHKIEPDQWTMLEEYHLHHSALGMRPPHTHGCLYSEQDEFLCRPEVKAKWDTISDGLRYARDLGLRVGWLVWSNIAGVAFAREHPEYMATGGTDLWLEGLTLCPSHPEVMDYLASFMSEQYERLDFVDQFMVISRDPGGCECPRCQPQTEIISRMFNFHTDLIAEHRPGAAVNFFSWHIHNAEVPAIAANLPRQTVIYEAPRIHANDNPPELYEQRIDLWRKAGFNVESWVEIQENPTALLPSIYPGRIAAISKVTAKHAMTGTWATSTQNPYLIPLHMAIFPKIMRHPDENHETLVADYFRNAYGDDAVEPALTWARLYEQALDAIQSLAIYEAGFIGLFVTFWGHNLLPAKAIEAGVSDDAVAAMNEAKQAAESAYEAAEQFADTIRRYHAQDANIIAASAEFFALRVALRAGKAPVIQALHEGDAKAAVDAWKPLIDLCEQMVAAARNAPNTDVLLHHWRKFETWPDRMRVLAEQFPELAVNKRCAEISPAIIVPLNVRKA